MNKSTFVIGGLLIFFGLFFLMESIGLFWFDFGEFISFMIPFGLIAFGVWLIVRKKDKESKAITVTIHADTKSYDSSPPKPPKTEYTSDSVATPAPPAQPASPTPPVSPAKPAEFFGAESSDNDQTETSPRIRYSKMFGDMYIDCKGKKLSNIEISTGVGDLELNLIEGILSKGLNRVIISGFIGDIRIFVSKEMSFFSHCSNFIGDIDLSGQRTSGFGNTLEHDDPGYDQAESKLYVAANSFIGNIKVYRI
ncbi:MAG: hypothetical protein IID63_00205 [candidate division Zixibacteria bacterium]|nr:hypothetical protein [candidate division Zixibacteria bacterium]